MVGVISMVFSYWCAGRAIARETNMSLCLFDSMHTDAVTAPVYSCTEVPLLHACSCMQHTHMSTHTHTHTHTHAHAHAHIHTHTVAKTKTNTGLRND